MSGRKKRVSRPTGESVEGTPVQFCQANSKDTALGFSSSGLAIDLSTTERSPRRFDEVETRLKELRAIAEDEGLEISVASGSELHAFLYSSGLRRRPYIALLDNGNLRAVWKNARHEQIGLQFRGDKLIQYVLLAFKLADQPMAKAVGRDTFDNVWQMIEFHGLRRLLQ